MPKLNVVSLIIISLGFTVFCVLQPLFSFSKNYYVSSKFGNDRFLGTSRIKPKKTIQNAIDVAKPGDYVLVMNGIYTNDCPSCNVVVLTKGGLPGRYITLSSCAGEHPVIKFDGWAGILVTNGASYINIIGLEVEGGNSKINLKDALKQPHSCENKKGDFDAKYNGNGIAITGVAKKFSHHITISRNIVHDCSGGGIGATHADYINVNDNLVYNNAWFSLFGTSGISFYQFYNYDNGRNYHNRIERNKCYNNKSMVPGIKSCVITDGNGIIIDDFRNWQNQEKPKVKPYQSRTLIANNICWFNGGTAIHTFQSDHVDIVNNTAYCNSQSKEARVGEILPGGSGDIQIVNNIIVVDSLNAINSNFISKHIIYSHNLHYNVTNPANTDAVMYNQTCVIGKNPLFVSPGNTLTADFRIKAGSAAIGKGNQILYSPLDITGKKRRMGRAPDIGAYQF